jgi:hypothetical protein
MPGQNLLYLRGRIEFKPTLLSWRGDVYDSYSAFLWDSAKSALGNGLEGVVIGGVIDFAAIMSGNENLRLAAEHPFVVPGMLGAAGALYGALKRGVYGVKRPSLRDRWENFKDDMRFLLEPTDDGSEDN